MSMEQAVKDEPTAVDQGFEEARFDALKLSEADLKEIEHVFREDIGNDEFNERSLERIRLPAGGTTVWTVTNAEGTTHPETIKGIILQYNRPRAMWFERRKHGEPARPPDCYSLDGEKGNYRHQPPGTVPEKGEPGADCFSCKFNQPGSNPERPESRSKRCPEKRTLFLLTENSMMPVIIQLPVTSITNFNTYKTRLFTDFKRLSRVVTAISLEADENDTGDPYTRATFLKVGELNDLEKIGMSRYEDYCLKELNSYLEADQKRQLLSGNLEEPAALTEGQGQNGPVPPGEIPATARKELEPGQVGQDKIIEHQPAPQEDRPVESVQVPTAPGAPEAAQANETIPAAGSQNQDVTWEQLGDNAPTEESAQPSAGQPETPAAEPAKVVDDPFGDSMLDHNDEVFAREYVSTEDEDSPNPPGEPFQGGPQAQPAEQSPSLFQ